MVEILFGYMMNLALFQAVEDFTVKEGFLGIDQENPIRPHRLSLKHPQTPVQLPIRFVGWNDYIYLMFLHSLFFSTPAIGTKLTGRDSDGLFQVIQPVIAQ